MKSNIYNTLLQLVQCPSITESLDEKNMAHVIYSILQEISYFHDNPNQLMLYPIPDHDLYSIIALWKNPLPTKKTIILLSHFDVVAVDEYGYLKDHAFDPEFLAKEFHKLSLPFDVQDDLTSGDWLFGRGTMDMKCGLAIEIELLRYYAAHPEKLDCNLLLLAVPDEEGNSRGMLGSASMLLALRDTYDLDYHLVINTEPFFPLYAGDTKKYLYTGSIGKLLPMIYCAGKETHVGEPYSGLNPNLILSEINRRIEANPQFCESWGRFVTPPPSCLKQKDLKDSYSVQIPRAAVAYYNWMILRDTPQVILNKLKKVSQEAIVSVLEERTKQVTAYLRKSDYPLQVPTWDVEVKTYEEVYGKALETHGDGLIQYLNQQITQWIENGIKDDRELTIKMVDTVYAYYPEKKPLVILLFAPPYYPSCFNEGTTNHEAAALAMVDELIAYAQSAFDTTLEPCAFFPGLSDNSYFGVKNGQSIVHEFKPNMPLWGISYDMPIDTLEQIHVPVLNIGTLGKDPHKYTERLNLPYSLTATPAMIMKCLEHI